MSTVDNTWVLDLEPTIVALVKTRANKLIKTKYPNVNWTTDDTVIKEPVFPNIYILTSSTEIGKDMIGQDINGVSFTVQVRITVSKEQGMSGARFIAGKVMNEFKNLGFALDEIPRFEGNTPDTKQLLFRAYRIIGQADILN